MYRYSGFLRNFLGLLGLVSSVAQDPVGCEGYLKPSLVRILLVEDFRPQRSLTASLLSKDSTLAIISEANDGLEAIEQAQRLRPDVILLDIGLPKLNGLATARRIRNLIPSVKIVFVTQETDIDVVKEAFSLGALGYVHKQDAASSLLAAVVAVLRGERFVSRTLGKGEPSRPGGIRWEVPRSPDP